jgi:hypothetical protein
MGTCSGLRFAPLAEQNFRVRYPSRRIMLYL